MKVIESPKGLLHLEFPTILEMTLSMCRISEFYESPHKHILGHYFSLEDFIKAYSDDKGNIEYFSYWEGFNIPWSIIKCFCGMFYKDITRRESAVVKLFAEHKADYLIATYVDSDPTVKEHEYAHFYWNTNDAYRRAEEKIVKSIPEEIYEKMKADLMNGGYPSVVIDDEIHAYLKTSTQEELDDTFKSVPRETYLPFIDQLKAVPNPT